MEISLKTFRSDHSTQVIVNVILLQVLPDEYVIVQHLQHQLANRWIRVVKERSGYDSDWYSNADLMRLQRSGPSAQRCRKNIIMSSQTKIR